MFLGFSLEVLHHYWLLVPRKLDRFWSYLIWRCWLRRLFFQICPFLGLEKRVFVCDMWEIRIQRCVSVSSCFWTYRWRDKIVWWFWIFFSWYHVFLFPFLCSRSVLFFTLVWGVLAARCQLVVCGYAFCRGSFWTDTLIIHLCRAWVKIPVLSIRTVSCYVRNEEKNVF